MNPNIQAALITAGFSIFSAILGYYYKEYKNRQKPFINLHEFRGDVQKKSVEIKVPKNIVEKSEKSSLIRHLFENDTLSGLDKTLDGIKEIYDDAEDVLGKLDNCITILNDTSKQDDTVIQAIQEVFLGGWYERFVLLLIVKDKLKVTPSSSTGTPIIDLHPSKDRSGCMWVAFPGSAKQFGKNFDDEPILKSLSMPYLEAISKLDRPCLSKIYSTIHEQLKDEVLIAKAIRQTVEDAVDEHCMWGIEVFMANLSRYPLLVMNEAKLFVSDQTGAKYSEACYLVLLKPNNEGGHNRYDTKSPLVIKSGEDCTFEFLTNKTQTEMQRGKALRDAFQAKNAKAKLEMKIRRAGIKDDQIISTDSVPFQMN
jgi:hypothetical protein